MSCLRATEAQRRSSAAPPYRTNLRSVSGVLVIDKPEGVSSFGVVHKIKRILDIKKAGHCGTLDPFATGVLIVCLGQATKIADWLLTQDKAYTFSARLGAETDTQDKTGVIVAEYDVPAPSEEKVRNVLRELLGTSVQQVPSFSAVKVGGKRLYRLTRNGIEVELPQRSIFIGRLELLAYKWPEIRVEVHCSKGTYIRRLASDIGRKLGCGAFVTELRREASGSFTARDAIPLDDVSRLHDSGELECRIIPIDRALQHLPALAIEDRAMYKQIRDGYLSENWQEANRVCFNDERTVVRLLTVEGSLLALWRPHPPTGGERRLRPFH